jgi:hypothetical protein
MPDANSKLASLLGDLKDYGSFDEEFVSKNLTLLKKNLKNHKKKLSSYLKLVNTRFSLSEKSTTNFQNFKI